MGKPVAMIGTIGASQNKFPNQVALIQLLLLRGNLFRCRLNEYTMPCCFLGGDPLQWVDYDAFFDEVSQALNEHALTSIGILRHLIVEDDFSGNIARRRLHQLLGNDNLQKGNHGRNAPQNKKLPITANLSSCGIGLLVQEVAIGLIKVLGSEGARLQHLSRKGA